MGRAARTAIAAASFACLVACGAACTKASESQEGKRMPKPPPPPSAEVESGLRIDVTIDGQPAPPIDAARLATIKPDFEDDERRAWKIATLLGPSAARPGVAFEATGDRGVSVVARPPKGAGDPIPVLTTSRRGEAHFGLVPPDQPFPAYHGQGGRLARPGDPLPRISGVSRIRVYVEAADDARDGSALR